MKKNQNFAKCTKCCEECQHKVRLVLPDEIWTNLGFGDVTARKVINQIIRYLRAEDSNSMSGEDK